MRRVLQVLLLTAFSLAVLPAAQGASEDAIEVPISITAFDQAQLAALQQTEPVDVEWNPLMQPEAPNPEDLTIESVRALAFRLANPTLFGDDVVKVLRGPQGTLFETDRFNVRNEPVSSFYGTNDVGTVVVAEVTGWPETPDTAIYELAVAFNWAGDEVLTESPFPGDPLIGYGNVSSFGWLGGSTFINYANVQLNTWVQYADPLLSSEISTVDDRFFVTWLLPGVPDTIAVNLSYSSDATFESMVAQHVEVEVPLEISEYSLTSNFTSIEPDFQQTYEQLFVEEEQPPADSGTDDASEDTGDTEEEVEGSTDAGETVAEVDEPEESTETPVENAPTDDAGAVGVSGSDEGGGIPGFFLALIPITGGILIWLIYKWYFASKADDTNDLDDALSPVQQYDLRNDPLAQAAAWNATVATRHRDAGGTVSEGGWFAPTFGEVAVPGEKPEGNPDEWTGYFLNADSFERVNMDDPRFGELLSEVGVTPPVEYVQPSAFSEEHVKQAGDELTVDQDVPGPATDTDEPVIRSHHGAPSQVMTAREEALGLAEAMVGIVVDGWHLLPWETGSDFFIGSDGRTYRTIPVARVDVLTDVEFAGEPPDFEPDSSRYGYWLHEDGTLKIGSPEDPHAYSEPAPQEPGPTLESQLPTPGAGQTLLDVHDERLIRAHELTGGAAAVDGWIAPSNEARGAAMLSDSFTRPTLEADAWSGQFFHTETGEWVKPGDARYRELVEKLNVTPPVGPIESTKPINMDGDIVGPQ